MESYRQHEDEYWADAKRAKAPFDHIKDRINYLKKSIAEDQMVIRKAGIRQRIASEALHEAVFEWLGNHPEEVDQETVFEYESTKLPDTSAELVLGLHNCPKSPTNQCVYNKTTDPALDFCLFCGGPNERK